MRRNKRIVLRMRSFISILFVSVFTFSAIAQDKTITDIVNEMSEYQDVTGYTSGFAGSVSPQYRLFLELNEAATDSELKQLLSHQSAVVATYAYWAMDDKEVVEFDELFKIAPNEKIIFIYGCVGTEYTRRSLMEHLKFQPILG